MSSTSSPCAACKFLRRKCTQECVFAPYFPPDHPQKFSNVHKVFGASNIAKILNELSPSQREDAVNSLAFEADARLRDPVYGCVGHISILQHRLKQVQNDLYNAKKELARYIGPSAMLPLLPQIGLMQQQMQYNSLPAMLGGLPLNPQMVTREPVLNQIQMMEAQQQQQMAATRLGRSSYMDINTGPVDAVREQHELMKSYEQQQEMGRFSAGFDVPGTGSGGMTEGFSQMSVASSTLTPTLALGSSADVTYQGHFHHQLHLQPQTHSFLQQQNHREGSVVGPC